MPENLLAILTICLVVLVYLFFFRVVRAVWAELRPPAAPAERRAAAPSPGPRPGRRSGATHLVLIEPKERKGTAWELADELTVGRAAGCAVALDDSYVSQLHARVFRRDGRLFCEDLGSTNGTFVNKDQVSAAVAVSKGDRLRFGSTVLEVR